MKIEKYLLQTGNFFFLIIFIRTKENFQVFHIMTIRNDFLGLLSCLFRGTDLVPSDAVAGFILLRIRQKYETHELRRLNLLPSPVYTAGMYCIHHNSQFMIFTIKIIIIIILNHYYNHFNNKLDLWCLILLIAIIFSFE